MTRMDASLLPVLSLWAPAAAASTGSGEGLPEAMERLGGCAATADEALSRALTRRPGRDVLLLRADAELPEGLWPRLASAWANGGWDVLSPLDGGWPVFDAATPTRERDALAWGLAEHATFACPSWSPVCSLWRGATLAHRSPDDLDEWRSGLLPCAYVGPALAPGADEPPLALADLEARIKSNPRPLPGFTAPTLLHVLHGWGGGVERFARDLAAADVGRRHLLLVAYGQEHHAPYGRRLQLHLDLDAPPIRSWTLARPVDKTALHSPEVQAILATITAEWGVGSVLVSSLIGHSLDVLRTGLPTACCVHDSYPVWPLLHDARDPGTEPFDRDALAEGLAHAGPGFILGGHLADQWWRLRSAFLEAAAGADAIFVAPSEFARRRLCEMAPALADRRWQVLPHGLAPLAGLQAAAPPSDAAAGPLRVLVLGRLQGGKGERLLKPLLASLPAGIELLLLGSGNAGADFEGLPSVQVHRDYEREQLPQWMQRLQPDLILLPSTVPETFSYTLSEALALRVPVLCAAPGAPADRLRELGLGWVVAPEPAAANGMLAHLSTHRDEIAAMAARPAPAQPTLADMATAWRNALPPASGVLRLLPATPAAVEALAIESRARELSRRLLQGEHDHAQDRAELDRRAQWARGLEQALQQERAQRQGAEQALAQVQSDRADMDRQIHELDRQLADAHGFYQRDTVDLARQRDVALAQRDQSLASLSTLQGSLPGRLAALAQRLGVALRHGLLALGYRWRHANQQVRRGLASLRTRGIAATWRRIRQQQAAFAIRPAAAMASSPAPHRPLRLPQPASPRASVIVPVYNQLHYTLACLRALADCGDHTGFEVIVVDDASTDDTPRVLPGIPGLRYHRNQANLGFIGACNAGAGLAKGEFVVFLNNDTTVSPGWLDALLDTFATHPDTGLAGSKLVYPDGRLQEAGGVVFADGSGWNYGRFDDPTHPRFNHVREVDYCSGASIALRRELFQKLGGFDDHYAPAYYEDTDLAMRVRACGLKVRYQPASEVVHHEGITSGTDLNRGMKAYQVTNQAKFLARWRDELARSHAPADSDPERACDRGRHHRVLVLDACTPTPDRDSGSLRMSALMRALRDEGCSVTFFAESGAHDGAYTRALQQMGVEVWWHPHLADVPAWLARHGHRFDLVVASRHYVLAPLLPLLRRHAPRAHLVFDTVDLHHLREQREAEVSGDTAQRRQAERTRRVELDLIARSDSTWVVSSAEQVLLASQVPEAKVDVVSNIHDVHGPGRPWAQRRDLLFVGGYRHPPNVDAALWLATEILPLVRARLPGVVLHLVGADAPPEVMALADLPGVQLHGYVPDLLPLLEGVRVGVAPLRYGAGVKGKVNQSLAHGQPMVATPCAVEGMHLVDGEDVLVADGTEAIADAVVRLYEDASLWERLAAGGLENTRRHFSPAAARATLRTLLASLPPR